MKRFSNHSVPFLLGLLGAAAVIAGLAGVFSPGEPVCQGKPLSFWVSQLDPWPDRITQSIKDRSLPIDMVRPGFVPRVGIGEVKAAQNAERILAQRRTDHDQAVAAIQTIGPKAIPFLLPKVRYDFSSFRIGSRIIWSRLPARMQRRFTGPESADYSKTAVALSLLGPAAMPQWKEAFVDPSSVVRLLAVRAVGEIGPPAAEAVPAVARMLNDPDTSVEYAALGTLRALGASSKVAVDDLIRFLRAHGTDTNLDALVRQSRTMQVLGRIGPDAQAAVPEIVQQLTSPSGRAKVRGREVLTFALQALAQIYPEGAKLGNEVDVVAVACSKLLKDPEPEVRARAAVVLWRIEHDTNAIAVIIAALKDEQDSAACFEIIRCLGEIGPAAKSAIPEILRRADELSQNPDYRLAPTMARSIVGKIDPEAAANVQVAPP